MAPQDVPNPPMPSAAPEPADAGPLSRLPRFWRVQLVVWGLFALADLATRATLFQSLPVALVMSVLVTPLMLLGAGLLHGIYRRAGLGRGGRRRAVGVILPASLAVAILLGCLSALLRWLLGWEIPAFNLTQALVAPGTFNFAVLTGWSLGYVWIISERARREAAERAARAEAEALAADLARLRLQLDPHFLFNALNGIAAEIPDRPPAAVAMVRELSDYLRHSLETIDRAVVSVAEEVAGLRAYLNVQSARFADRLDVALDVDPALSERPVAGFLLQPLVENAFKHGRRRPRLVLAVAVRAEGEEGQALRITVHNSGTLALPAARRPDGPGGLGLVNLRRRLALQYPGRHSFTLSADGGRVTADLVLSGPPCSAS